ncbi:MAG: class I SAM-dependent methyltransferase [Gammaproteobacteria bacterium]|nr:class I SAM-dependent methyltransferase [Gammaproteobacteria bacterium]
MSIAAMARLIAREMLGSRQQARGPSPLELLSEETVLGAMRGEGRAEGRTAAGYLYHTARISQVLQGRRRCLDLGCGTGVQLLQVAGFNPEVRFVGVDQSATLLAAAEEDASRVGLTNVSFLRADMTELAEFDSRSFDAVVSTMSLHFLADRSALRTALLEMARIGGVDAAFYLEDFARLKSPLSVAFFLERNAQAAPDPFDALYRASLEAAFTLDELKTEIAHALPRAAMHVTSPVPFLLVAHTPAAPLPAALRAQIRSARASLSPSQSADLDALRRAFALGEWRADPFL